MLHGRKEWTMADIDSHVAPSPPGDAASFDPLLDIALFLAHLQAADVHPLHGRWLPPRHFHALGSCLLPAVSCHDQRSERQSDRLPFVHYLAESLGLLTLVSNLLKPSPAALGWLERQPSAQFRDLWQVWLSTSDENRQRWTRYHLPAYKLRDPVALARRVADLLSAWPIEQRLDPHNVVCPILAELIPWWERNEGKPAQTLLHDILAGPLTWLGVVRQTESGQRQPSYSLTSLGAWLLDRPCIPPPPDDTQPLLVTQQLELQLPPRPRLGGILALAEWAELEPGPRLRFTTASLIRARERGATWPDLQATLARHAVSSLAPDQQDTLRERFKQVASVSLEPSLLLRTPDAALLAELWQTPAVRPHLGDRLAPDLAAVETPSPEALVKALHRQGLAICSLFLGKGDLTGFPKPVRSGELRMTCYEKCPVVKPSLQQEGRKCKVSAVSVR